jgi:putative endonuclease
MAITAKGWFLYLARCSDGTIYTGIARDVAARMAAHDAGRGARYTRGRGPLALCAVRRCASKSEAQRLEYAVKKLLRVRKEKLLSARGLGAFCRRVGVEAAIDQQGPLDRRAAGPVKLSLTKRRHVETRQDH